MTLDELAVSLPNGFHDAIVYTIAIDYLRHQARFDLDIWVGNLDANDSEQREAYKRAELTLSGLEFWATEPPDASYPYRQDCLTIDIGPMHALAAPVSSKLPPIPPDAFANWIFVSEWNAFIYLAAKDAQLAWTGPPRGTEQGPAADCLHASRSGNR